MQLGFVKDSSSDRDAIVNSYTDLIFLKFGYDANVRVGYLEAKYWDEHRGLARTIITGNLDDPKLKELDNKLQGYPPLESGVRIAFSKLWIFAPNSGN